MICFKAAFRPVATGFFLVFIGYAGQAASSANLPAKPALTGIYTLPPMSLDIFTPPGQSPYNLAAAKARGLKFTDLPSIGSGLARRGDGALFGITDRGPNSHLKSKDSDAERRVFPLPDFCPSIARLELTNGEIRLPQVLPLTGTHGEPLTGLSNSTNEETCYESLDAAKPLPPDPDGVDPESIRCLPGGGFVLSEEYSPSVFVVNPIGRVLVRYTPTSKPLTGAHYPVQPILPDIFCRRRVNRGFEGVALSKDGRTLYAILQSPMGDADDPRYAGSRIIRVLEMDFTDPLHAKVTGIFLLRASAFSDFPGAKKQDKVKISEIEWLAPHRLLVLEQARKEAHVFVADLSNASNVLHRPEAETLRFEDVHTDLGALGIQAAKTTRVFSSAETPGLEAGKIEGMALLQPDVIALANDNDFGIGDNAAEPSKVWTVRIPALLSFEQ